METLKRQATIREADLDDLEQRFDEKCEALKSAEEQLEDAER